MGNELHMEIERNYRAFKRLAEDLIPEREGQFALMRDERILSFHESAGEALRTALNAYPDGRYSIQEVRSAPLDLGYVS